MNLVKDASNYSVTQSDNNQFPNQSINGIEGGGTNSRTGGFSRSPTALQVSIPVLRTGQWGGLAET